MTGLNAFKERKDKKTGRHLRKGRPPFQKVKTLFSFMASFYFKIKRIDSTSGKVILRQSRTVNLGCLYGDRSLGIRESASCPGLEAEVAFSVLRFPIHLCY